MSMASRSTGDSPRRRSDVLRGISLEVRRGETFAFLGHNAADTIHVMAEAMKLAYADRSEYLGDPDFWKVPVADGLSAQDVEEILVTADVAIDLDRRADHGCISGASSGSRAGGRGRRPRCGR